MNPPYTIHHHKKSPFLSKICIHTLITVLIPMKRCYWHAVLLHQTSYWLQQQSLPLSSASSPFIFQQTIKVPVCPVAIRILGLPPLNALKPHSQFLHQTHGFHSVNRFGKNFMGLPFGKRFHPYKADSLLQNQISSLFLAFFRIQ